ncbi:glycosyltransferase, group 1 family protein [Neisseria sp. oral taxon 014 str. F0314]|uniref:glycosyltransferase n=1 Tax=Neisseria sp. oral taxon 014 TaxID=641148 RepID=UPI0001D8CC6F|nr:glycosyltransferase [Neisseria sp. oral taxon 014]EFI22890.1 glycosyltransferase, group 1 family protein [Neisseria sp. oral taxon 014 str. F0314]
MHVLIIPSWYPETPEDVDGIFFRLQAQALQRSGLKIGVTAPVFRSMRGKPASVVNGGYGIRSYTEENIPTYVYKSMYFFPRLPYLDRHRWVGAGWKLFKRYVRDHGTPDIIHAHSMNHAGILAQQIHEKTGIPFVLTEHSSTYARKLIRNWQRPAMLQSAQQCSARIAVSKDFCRLLETEYGGPDWQYIPNSLSPAFIRPVDLANKPKNADFTFCSVAHLNYNKGFDILLPAFAEALKTHPDLKLKIGGTGLIASQLHNLAAELGLENSVEFLGGLQNDQVLDLMFRSDAFVLASRNETFGVVFIEALSQGLPVAATRCGGPQTIINENNGILVPVGDVQALAGALVSLYENRGRYDAQTLRADCLSEFGEEAVVRQITAVYKTILGGTHES